MISTKEKIERLIEENSKISSDQIEYAKKYEKLVNTFNTEKENYVFKSKIKNQGNSSRISSLIN